MRKIVTLLMGCLLFFTFTTANASPPKKWTFLVYVNGNNSLDEFGAANIRSMEKVGSNDEVNVVVQWASLSARKTVRLLIQKSSDSSTVSSPVIEDLGVADMGNVQTLDDFIKWGVEHYPAEHYFIDVWNHGSGWHLHKNNIKPMRDISWDDLSGNSISTEQLGQAIKYAATIMGHPVDIYGSDACLMGMAEVAHEMTGSVNYFVGSQEVEPGEGWPYADLLSRWEALPNASASDVSKLLVNAYVKSYQGGSNGKNEVTFSAYDVNRIHALDSALSALGTNMRQLSPSSRQRVLQIAKKVQVFTYSDYADLLDFMKKLAATKKTGLDQKLIKDVQKAAEQLIIANAVTQSYSHATGLSIWLPTDSATLKKHAERYHNLQFNTETQWGDTLSFLLQGAHLSNS